MDKGRRGVLKILAATLAAVSCYHPLTAYRSRRDGSIAFCERVDAQQLLLPCGQCIGCRLERSRQWAIRCMHEAQMHTHNCFVTLTYQDNQVPENHQLVYRDWQLFMKRLRKHAEPSKLRFYMAGEYGENFGRPHFHACIFGWDFLDKLYLRTTPSKSKLYRSPTLEKLWTKGFSSIGDVTFETAAYVARYVMKKITGQQAEKHYTKINLETGEIYKQNQEMNQMSRRPGIGLEWLKRYTADVYPQGTVIVRGTNSKTPRYYDKWFKKTNPDDYRELIESREQEAYGKRNDNTDQRLAVKEVVTKARIRNLKRTID